MIFKNRFAYLVKVLLLGCFFAGCSSNTMEDQTAYHDDGRKKPSVCLVSVFDSSLSKYPWSLSEEFTTAIQRNLMRSKELYLVQDYALINYLLSQEKNFKPFIHDIHNLNNLPLNAEFVVFLELIQHETNLSETTSHFNDQLEMAMRVRIIDLRGKQPKIILQELLEKKASLKGSLAFIDYDAYHWASTSFSLLPIGIAHKDFTSLLAERVEEYIMVAKYH